MLNGSQAQNPLQKCTEGEEYSDNEDKTDFVTNYRKTTLSHPQQSAESVEETQIPTSPRGQPVGKETSINVRKETLL